MGSIEFFTSFPLLLSRHARLPFLAPFASVLILMRTCARSLRRPVAAAALVKRVNSAFSFAANRPTSSASKPTSLSLGTMATRALSSSSASVADDYKELTDKLKELSALQVSGN